MMCEKSDDARKITRRRTREESMQLIAEAFQELLKCRSINEITVSDVMNRCGMTRQMFYHYYRDLDDLVFEIHLGNTIKITETFFEEKNFIDTLEHTLETMCENRAFYRRIIQKEGPTSFTSLFYKNIMENTRRFLGGSISDPDVEIALRVYWRGAIYEIEEWIRQGQKQPPAILARQLYRCLPDTLKHFYPEAS